MKIAVLGVCCLAMVASADAEEMRAESVGVHYGISSSNSSPPVHRMEAFATLELPWHWSFCKGWRLRTQLEVSAGRMTCRDSDGFVGAVGPRFLLGRKTLPLFLMAGASPTVLSRHEFVGINLGTDFQFTSYGGLLWDIGPHFRLDYRFQHISNAALSRLNPGLNMHVVGVSWRF